MTKIKHKFTFGGSLPSSIIRVSPFFTFAFSSVSSYELEKKEQMTLALILRLLGCMTGSNDERYALFGFYVRRSNENSRYITQSTV